MNETAAARLDALIDPVAVSESVEMLVRDYDMDDSLANDVTWDVAREVIPRAVASVLRSLSERDGEVISLGYLRELADSWATIDH